ncbi:PREDICTED: integral membrane protein 2C-like [Scomber scombrus]|uniref:Integral membrane protein 2 n=1 Tax=Scomber scombrus TaxID=13677 RepID=A0AAV1P3P3_SCOSC
MMEVVKMLLSSTRLFILLLFLNFIDAGELMLTVTVTRFILADLAVFHEYISQSFNLSSKNTWISFGGSYSGALSAWFRGKKGTYLPQTYILHEEMVVTGNVHNMRQLGPFIYRLCNGKDTYRLNCRVSGSDKSWVKKGIEGINAANCCHQKFSTHGTN